MSASAPRIFAAVEDSFDQSAIREALPVGAPLRIVSLQDAREQASADLQQGADLVIVGCSANSDDAVDVIAAAVRQRADRPVVVLYGGSPNGFLTRAFEAGADDLITLPQPPSQLAFALEKALARRRGAASTTTSAPMVTVLGPKGGTGKTLTSCNAAVALALRGTAPVLVDVDLQFGDVGLALGLPPARTIYDLVTAGGSLDADKVDGYLTRHPSGAAALLAPVRPDQAAAVTVPFLRELYEILRARYDVVLVDTPPAFSPEVIASIDSSTALCVVGMLDALSLKDTKIGLETLQQMGYGLNDVTLVLNRADTDVGITARDVEQMLGRPPDVLVPSDRAIPRAVTSGEPIVVAAPKSAAAKAFDELVDRFAVTPRTASREFVAAAPVDETSRKRFSLRKRS